MLIMSNLNHRNKFAMLNKIISWLDDFKSRQETIQNFNKNAKDSYVQKQTSLLLEAKTSIGSAEYKHAYSKFMASGFNIKAFSKTPLNTEQLQSVGKDLIKDEAFIRKLISLGWDTLEVQDVDGNLGCKWELNKYVNN